MIATKILGLTAAVSKSKKLKIALLLAEVALFALALKKDKDDNTGKKALDKE